jgi:hypothetical protein
MEEPWWNVTYCPKCSPPGKWEGCEIKVPAQHDCKPAIIAELEDLKEWVLNPDEIVDWVTVTVEIRRRIEFLKGGPARKEGGDAQ